MAWARLDDQFFTNAKVVDLSKDAKLLYLAAVTFASRELTDGRVSPGALRIIAAMVDADRAEADTLVAAGLWECDGADYIIHDYLDYNPSADEVKAKREQDRERKRVGSRREVAEDSARTPDGSASESNGPVPIPVPVPNPEPTAAATARERASELAHSIAETLKQAPWVGDELGDVARAVERSLAKVPEFNAARDGPLLAEQYVVWKGYAKKPPANWYAAWLNWLKGERERANGRAGQPASGSARRARPADRRSALDPASQAGPDAGGASPYLNGKHAAGVERL